MEVSREVDILRVRVLYSMMTDRQPVIYLTANHLLARHTRKDKKASLSFICFKFSAITRNEIPPRTLTGIEAFKCIS